METEKDSYRKKLATTNPMRNLSYYNNIAVTFINGHIIVSRDGFVLDSVSDTVFVDTIKLFPIQ